MKNKTFNHFQISTIAKKSDMCHQTKNIFFSKNVYQFIKSVWIFKNLNFWILIKNVGYANEKLFELKRCSLDVAYLKLKLHVYS